MARTSIRTVNGRKAVFIGNAFQNWVEDTKDDKSIWEQMGMGSSKGRKAQGSAEKSYLDKGIEIVKGLFD